MDDLKNKELPFYATVNGDYLDCYDWEDGDRLVITDLKEELDASNNEYLWLAINLTKLERGAVSTYQINIKE